MPADAVKKDLTESGHRYGLYQALRLLQQSNGKVSIRPALSLGFPAGDITEIKESEHGHEIQVTPLGLYGSGSPLPAFYTEELLDEAASDQEMMRGLFEVINGSIYDLLFRCWEKNRLPQKVVDQQAEEDADRLYALGGLNEQNTEKSLLCHVAHLARGTRSAWGLETLLRDAFPGVPIHIVQCVPRTVPIPEDQRPSVGVSAATLGDDAVLGATICDATGKMEVVLGPVGYDNFRSFFPSGEQRQRLQLLIETYLPEPLEFELTCVLRDDERKRSELGNSNFNLLGRDVWM